MCTAKFPGHIVFVQNLHLTSFLLLWEASSFSSSDFVPRFESEIELDFVIFPIFFFVGAIS